MNKDTSNEKSDKKNSRYNQRKRELKRDREDLQKSTKQRGFESKSYEEMKKGEIEDSIMSIDEGFFRVFSGFGGLM